MIHPIAAAALLVAQAPPAAPQCLTREEISDIALSLAPTMIGAVAERCRPHLGPGAFFNGSGGEDYIARLGEEGALRRPAALRAFAKMTGGRPMEESTWPLMMAMFAGVTSGLRAEYCADIDRLIGALAPLPPADLGAAIAAVGALTQIARPPRPSPEAGEGESGPGEARQRRPRRGGSIVICPA